MSLMPIEMPAFASRIRTESFSLSAKMTVALLPARR
jgi:hypothetical protein